MGICPSRSPGRLLVVATGNITNAALLALFGQHLTTVIDALDEVDMPTMPNPVQAAEWKVRRSPR